MLTDQYLSNRFLEVDSLVAKAKGWKLQDPELDGHLGDYLCIVICGVFEDCVEHLLGQRAGKAQDAELEAFVTSLLADNFRNPKDDKLAGILGRFSDRYKRSYRKRIKPQSRAASALDSIVETKNAVAHGAGHTSHRSVQDVEDYYRRAMRVFEVLEGILL